ncbi:MAG: flagellar hook-length control protein FliK [Pseudomonadota bacterium]
MLLRADAVTIKPVAPVEAPSAVAPIGDARQEAFQRAVQLTIGQKLQGEILSRMNDGTYLVKVAGTAARMMLPPGTQVGGTVALTLMSMEPRPTFALGADDTALSNLGKLADGAQQNSKLSRAPQLVYLDIHADDTSDAALANQRVPTKTERLVDHFVQISGLIQQTEEGDAAAALRGKILQTTADAEHALTGGKDQSSAPAAFSSTGRLINQMIQTAQQHGAASALQSARPLLASATANTTQVATALQDTLAFSGLFYEAHVNEWADGKRSMADLMREPQAQLNNQASDTSNVALAQLVNQQLTTLEHQRARWQGEIWPGQQLEWEVQKDAPDQSGNAYVDEDKQPWQSSVRFELPLLGAVSATIQLVGDHVQIQVRTASETTATSLRSFAGRLTDTLGAAGTQLDLLTVKQDSNV